MGTTFEFSCSTCGYKAIVSGGPDRGFTAKTATILCLDCKELIDVVTGEIAGKPDGSDSRRKAVCEEFAGHKVRRWRSGGPCPKCGATMVQGPPFCLWD